MKTLYNEPLSKHSTMRIGGMARVFVELNNLNELEELSNLINSKEVSKLSRTPVVLGEGSNTIFINDYDGLVIKNEIKGINIEEEDPDGYTTLKLGAGENWHNFVEYCVNQNLSGNENLAYIPGTVGAAPVQNIGAYGQVQEDTFLYLEAVNLETGQIRKLDRPECEFAYRSSVFKTSLKSKMLITSVSYKLKKASEYIPDTSYHSRYESLLGELQENSKPPYTLVNVFNAVVSLRKKKLPDWHEIGTVGSFFLNPFVNKSKLIELQKDFPNIQFYPVDKMQYPGLQDVNKTQEEIVKIPAGWILEELGFRGKRVGNVGCSEKHALCVVVYPNATGNELKSFVKTIQDTVFIKTGIRLETEVNIID